MANGRYEITQTPTGEYRFTLVTVSGKPIAHSGTYKTLAVCKKGIASLRINSDAPLCDKCELDMIEVATLTTSPSDIKCPKLELFKDPQALGGYNFFVYAKNGSVIASGEGYGTKTRCLEAIASLRYIAFSAETYIREKM